MTTANILIDGMHICRFCSARFKSRPALRRHQNTDLHCRQKQEEAASKTDGFTTCDYLWKYIPRNGRHKKTDPPILTLVKALGVEWFDSPSNHRSFCVPTWFFEAWKKWPAREEIVVMRGVKWVQVTPRRMQPNRHKRVYYDKKESVPSLSFLGVVYQALRDDKLMAKLKMRTVSDALYLYEEGSGVLQRNDGSST